VFGLGPATRIYFAVGATDMRKGFDGLYGLVRDRLGLEPLAALEVRTTSRSVHPLQASGRVSIERLDAASLDNKKARRGLLSRRTLMLCFCDRAGKLHSCNPRTQFAPN
jgi:IS66 Orf2 like protein